MKRFLFVVLACGACTVQGGKDLPPVQADAGSGLLVDPSSQSISIDQAHVPVLAACDAGMVVAKTGTGWACVAAAAALDAGQGLSETGGVIAVDSQHVPYLTGCGAGQTIQRGADGSSWTCVTQTAAGVTAGAGLTASGNTISVDSNQVALASACGFGQIAQKGASGWSCTSDFLSTETAAADYLGLHATADNATQLGGVAASQYLQSSAAATTYLGLHAKADGAANADQLGGVAASAYLQAPATCPTGDVLQKTASGWTCGLAAATASPALSMSPGHFDFGPVTASGVSPQCVVITNQGGADAQDFYVSAGGGFGMTAAACSYKGVSATACPTALGSTLAAGASCSVQVSFTASGAGGQRTGTLSASSSNGSSASTILTGNFSAPAGSQSNPGASCKDILAQRSGETLASGSSYWINPVNPGATSGEIEVYCDMTTDGGGWTFFAYVSGSDSNIGSFFNQNYGAYSTIRAPGGTYSIGGAVALLASGSTQLMTALDVDDPATAAAANKLITYQYLAGTLDFAVGPIPCKNPSVNFSYRLGLGSTWLNGNLANTGACTSGVWAPEATNPNTNLIYISNSTGSGVFWGSAIGGDGQSNHSSWWYAR